MLLYVRVEKAMNVGHWCFCASLYRILARLGRFRRYAAFDIFKEILKNRIITPLLTLRRTNLPRIFIVQ